MNEGTPRGMSDAAREARLAERLLRRIEARKALRSALPPTNDKPSDDGEP